MRINYIKLVGFKRFRLANIKEFEAEFPEAVTMIISESGKGKSSLLQQLNPTPPVRTDFEKYGYKEIHISHNGHNYILKSDFSNKTSPHSFICDEVELNIGHTTDVQTELVWQHFKISSLINNLVYAKTRITQASKSERKNLFLEINPIDLDLVVDTHKKVLGHIRDAKANLQMLQARKIQLESDMIPEGILNEHKNTKEKLTAKKQTVTEMIYVVNQNLTRLSKDNDFGKYNESMVDELNTAIRTFRIENCYKLSRYSNIPRDEAEYNANREDISNRISKLLAAKEYLTNSTRDISNRINDYNKHLEESKSNPIHSLEIEIHELDVELNHFVDLPEEPIEVTDAKLLYGIIDKITEYLLLIKESGVKLIDPSIIQNKYNEMCSAWTIYETAVTNRNRALGTIGELETSYNNMKAKANIPEGCNFSSCSLRNTIQNRLNDILDQIKRVKAEKSKYIKTENEYSLKHTELNEFLKPYTQYKLVSKFNEICRYLRTYFGYKCTDEEFIDMINIKGTLLSTELTNLVDGSIAYAEYTKIKTARDNLAAKLETLVQSSAVSVEFITKELDKLQSELDNSLAKLNIVDADIKLLQEEYNKYQEYRTAYTKSKELADRYDKVERILIVNKVYEYWEDLYSKLYQYSTEIDRELRNLDTIVETQDKLRYSYSNEILKQLEQIAADKSVYDKVELALSPNSGIAHRYMVKYLNTLIKNVNHFLSKIWAYPLVIESIDENSVIDYTFPIRVGNETNKDISMLSDGQTEIMNLVWVLTILLQMKLLNKMPFYADEITRCMDSYHRTKTIEFLNSLLDNKLIEQCFIINHFVSVSEGFKNCNIVCLSTDNLNDIPENANKNVKIINY